MSHTSNISGKSVINNQTTSTNTKHHHHHRNNIQNGEMNDYWHIPRASLASSSAASSASSSNRSHKSNSNLQTVTKRDGQQSGSTTRSLTTMSHGRSHAAAVAVAVHGGKAHKAHDNSTPRRNSELSATSAAATAAAAAAVLAAAAAPKRGSRSSQGSSDSNNSTRSAASGSLLLTAANLERFAEIHRRQDQQQKLYLQSPMTLSLPASAPYNATKHNSLPVIAANDATVSKTVYNANLMHSLTATSINHMDNVSNNINSNDAIITMDPNLNFIKTKDLDSVSLASSMHFTMVNGDDGPAKRPKRGLCDRGRQVTVLIVTMSTIFLLLIIGMVYALEMRAREMPQS